MSRKYWRSRNSKQLNGSVQKLFTTDGEVKSSKPLCKFQMRMFHKPTWLNTGQLQACEKNYTFAKYGDVTVKLMQVLK